MVYRVSEFAVVAPRGHNSVALNGALGGKRYGLKFGSRTARATGHAAWWANRLVGGARDTGLVGGVQPAGLVGGAHPTDLVGDARDTGLVGGACPT